MRLSLNPPYSPPPRHYQLDDQFRATEEPVNGRLPSGAYLPVPLADRNTAPQPADTLDVHKRINQVRRYVETWRKRAYPGVHRVSRELLEYWSSSASEPRPFFAQVEALETLIWLTEAAPQDPLSRSILDEIRSINDNLNRGIFRLAIKMATGTGKTRVMAMIILWHALKDSNPLHVLVMAPNLTVKDRLQALDPRQDTELYHELLPPHRHLPAGRLHVSIRNFQAFQLQNQLAIDGPKDAATGAAKKLLRPQGPDPRWQENPNQMVHRVLATHRGAQRILVLNDEAHHCYPAIFPPRGADSETKNLEQQAALWFTAIEILHQQQRLGPVYDLSATPMYLRTPPNLEYPLFPWVVSDYPLIEAIEAGLTKVPRVPIRDDTQAQQPFYRDLFNTLPQADRSLDPNRMPGEVRELLDILHTEYRDVSAKYAETSNIKPVLIIVTNTTENANAFYAHIAGRYDAVNGIGHPGPYSIFSNVDPNGPVGHPPTLLVHSGIEDASTQQDEKAKGLAAQQKLFFSAGEEATASQQTAHIREAFNTVGQSGKPGEHIRCLISVSMLTEGWDVKNVTHILGFRAFKSQLLCEQVAGRALRRTSVPALEPGRTLPLEYADIFGVPFTFMRGGDGPPPPPSEPWPVYSRPDHAAHRLFWPNIAGYRWVLPSVSCSFQPDRVQSFKPASPLTPTTTTISGTLGEQAIARSEAERENRILYDLASRAAHLFDPPNPGKPLSRRSLFTSMLMAVRAWLHHPAVQIDDLQLLAHDPNRETAAQHIADACVSDTGKPVIVPIFADEQSPFEDRRLDTDGVDFKTTLPHRYPKNLSADCRHSELNAAACHTNPEITLARCLDRHASIAAWVRNFRLGWTIPWYDEETGGWRRYEPDFLARIQHPEIRNLVIEFKGPIDPHANAKRSAIETRWLPAVNASPDPACRGLWAYLFLENESAIEAELDQAVQKHFSPNPA